MYKSPKYHQISFYDFNQSCGLQRQVNVNTHFRIGGFGAPKYSVEYFELRFHRARG